LKAPSVGLAEISETKTMKLTHKLGDLLHDR